MSAATSFGTETPASRAVLGKNVKVTGEIRSREQITGAPVQAKTALSPTARKSVLLPDIFDPLTIQRRVSSPSCRSFATEIAAGINGW